MTIETIARNAKLEDLLPMLRLQQDLKRDAVIPAQAMTSVGALIHVKGLIDGRPDATSIIRPTAIMDSHVAQRLEIPVRYVRRMREQRPDLYDQNFNGLIHGSWDYEKDEADKTVTGYGPDNRSFLLRTFADPDGGEGIGRALLSSSYGVIDHLDALMATIAGINDSGVDAKLVHGNISETRMTLRFAAPEIQALAPILLDGYNPPVPGWGDLNHLREVAAREGKGYDPGTEPVIFAGFDVDNSETGGGAFQVTPVLTIQACRNGARVNALAHRKIHVGSKMEDGAIDWSEDTKRKMVEVVTAQTRDAVTKFLDVEFLKEQIGIIEEKAGTVIDNPGEVVKLVAKKLAFTDEQQEGILNAFIKGSQMTAGGVFNAITAYSQTVASPDDAFNLDGVALEAMNLAAAAA